jgi:hypothetical protein
MATARTADPREKALKSARARTMTAAKRELDILGNAIEEHRKDLAGGKIPESAFVLRALKYEQARSRLELLAALRDGTDDGADDAVTDPVEVSAGDLGMMVSYLVSEITKQGGVVQPGTPLDNLVKAVQPDGPAVVQASEIRPAAEPAQDGAAS